MADGLDVVSDLTFDEEVLKSKEPVLVDFFAEWCGPCKAMSPVLAAYAADVKGKIKVVKIDVDQSPAVTQKYGIRAMPTLIVFKDGKVADQKVGMMGQKRQIEDFVTKATA